MSSHMKAIVHKRPTKPVRETEGPWVIALPLMESGYVGVRLYDDWDEAEALHRQEAQRRPGAIIVSLNCLVEVQKART